VLCDIDELAVADPRYDLGFLLDSARRRAPTAHQVAQIVEGYGRGLDPRELRWWALAAHLRRTVMLETTATTARERSWVRARRAGWREQQRDWARLVVPIVERPRPQQLVFHVKGLLATSELEGRAT
jgi:hypothetical protein